MVTRKEEIQNKTKPNPERLTGFQTLKTVKTRTMILETWKIK